MLKKIKRYIYHPLKNLLAKYYLIFLQKFTDIKVIAVTGSAGKTTTKEMVASILSFSAPTVWSRDNIDPVYNIASTILRCTPRTKYLILEMGVEKPGEMDFYLWLSKPDVGVITNVFPTHTEFFGDIYGVLKEKSKLVLGLAKDGFAVLNKNNQKLKTLAEKIKAKIVWFEGDNDACAVSIAKIFAVSRTNIALGLKKYDRPKHRLDVIKTKSGAVIFDDSYNSNPEALLMALKKFGRLAGNNTKIAILGDMLELGKLAVSEHKRIGSEIKKYGFTKVFGVGELIRLVTDDNFDNWKEALPEVKKYLKPKIYVFIKGSRSIGLDKLVERLV